MKHVWLLWFEHRKRGRLLLGVFKNEEEAGAMLERKVWFNRKQFNIEQWVLH
jgi:hypothetical protein